MSQNKGVPLVILGIGKGKLRSVREVAVKCMLISYIEHHQYSYTNCMYTFTHACKLI